ncbi:hypothetical protein L1987_79625 [Smallanthus sonchifolius]|uniref:Uncharacterized protein n=1 Tax=Smallanthus sonchifolius TaxID=185202 RepID=A0ACB8YKG4_9ASTR|nr:hypothetical protein L1987_79625 [Smallanthus sonchifolius]
MVRKKKKTDIKLTLNFETYCCLCNKHIFWKFFAKRLTIVSIIRLKVNCSSSSKGTFFFKEDEKFKRWIILVLQNVSMRGCAEDWRNDYEFILLPKVERYQNTQFHVCSSNQINVRKI